jgi:peptidyl-prolyl cis-trans isomerase B (cyclophilin B)
MADHKRATEVSVAPLAERSEFQEFVHKYWKAAAIVLLGVSGGFLFVQYRAARAEAAADAQWETFYGGVDMQLLGGADSGPALEAAAATLGVGDAGAWAAALEVAVRLDNREFDAATEALERLSADHGSNRLVTVSRDWGGDGREVNLIEYFQIQLQDWRSWSADNSHLFENPPPPADAPRVRLSTPEGDIVLALYPDRAPLHSANFLARVSEGYYDGTRFHRILAGRLVQGGDPNTRAQEGIEDDRATWGQGGPEELVPAEDSGLFHFEGVLAAAKRGMEPDSSGSQFYMTVGPFHAQDGRYTVFGAVVEGLDVLKSMAAEPVSEAWAQQPEEPVLIERAEVLP